MRIYTGLFLLTALNVQSEYSSNLNYRSSYEYEKYAAGLNKNKIPTLENLFQAVSYWDNSNASSPCPHVGSKRTLLCHKVVTFDREGYEKSLADTKKLLLSRLNLPHEPEIKINKNTLEFIDQLENNMAMEGNRKHSTFKTKYDMRQPLNKVFNSMHEASSVAACDAEDYTDSVDSELCLNFDLPMTNFVKISDGNLLIRKVNKVILWLFVRSSTEESSENIRLEFQSSSGPARNLVIDQNKLVDGWNTVNITGLFNLPELGRLQENNNTIKVQLSIKCIGSCSIGASSDDLLVNDENLFKNLLVSNSVSRKPLLSVSITDDMIDIPLSTKASRNKRKTSEGFVSPGLHNQPKLCANNYPDSNKECCLITYYVNFNSLRWGSWIINPTGFLANYCSGRCNEKKSFKYASHNAELKLKYNEKILSKDKFDSTEILDTCCHPVSMDSLAVKYLADNGSIISTVIPNMIITGCGCS